MFESFLWGEILFPYLAVTLLVSSTVFSYVAGQPTTAAAAVVSPASKHDVREHLHVVRDVGFVATIGQGRRRLLKSNWGKMGKIHTSPRLGQKHTRDADLSDAD